MHFATPEHYNGTTVPMLEDVSEEIIGEEVLTGVLSDATFHVQITGTVTVQIEASLDGENWQTIHTTAESGLFGLSYRVAKVRAVTVAPQEGASANVSVFGFVSR